MELAAQVGARLRALRESRGVSLSELARLSAVGKGTLSELETGRRNPTLETLYALTTALGVPLSTVLDTAPPTVSGQAVDAVLLDRFDDSAATTETYRIRIRETTRQHSAPHTPGTTEHLLVLTGTARFGTHTAPHLIGPGEHGHCAADVPHVYEAVDGPVEAVLMVRYPHRSGT
ncbi:helix-turn-helix transcriptional regulator [Nocardia terpenica]|uniref:helix-turn-helix domain-containing protein n=1 Tax=Nocardia terpenica TaxID=455432 RepID=UPI001892F96F|nr:helix-turn-helix transcriptional regulator [Nocardia terpenica]MBF6062788.1 helix-turn-helix transcriptional regulator [Nocardia terpenica]MBF6105077.1 helix-turn-helix transcriptional regulator [Nocardia terpenica]MBF6112486.1 helix-turn-helix transcriptional regulator [Nocardia terpenica]MBF6118805.1 helix-turn-helix transcriptional regulator [Nocardia terpenica]MBF6154274.1 helix-turn-helix transcriptional regulator [Nocardia terpenica]